MDFYSSIAGYYDDIFPLEINQLSFIKSSMGDSAGIFVDAGSATGSLSLAVAGMTQGVIGIEYDPELVEIAESKKDGLSNVVFYQGDMQAIRMFTGTGRITTVACMGNTLVHLNSFERISGFIGEVGEVLDKNGKLIIQIINYDRILGASIKELKTVENDRIRFIRNYNFDPLTGLIEFNTRLVIKNEFDRTVDNSVLLYPLLKSELDAILMKNGFNDRRYFGSFEMDEYSPESFLLIAAAEKS